MFWAFEEYFQISFQTNVRGKIKEVKLPWMNMAQMPYSMQVAVTKVLKSRRRVNPNEDTIIVLAPLQLRMPASLIRQIRQEQNCPVMEFSFQLGFGTEKGPMPLGDGPGDRLMEVPPMRIDLNDRLPIARVVPHVKVQVQGTLHPPMQPETFPIVEGVPALRTRAMPTEAPAQSPTEPEIKYCACPEPEKSKK